MCFGTMTAVSTLREGWQAIMGPLMVEMIIGEAEVDGDFRATIEQEVNEYIGRSTGINTILQMEHLVEMVRAHDLVPASQILTARQYKEIYNERLMVPVEERIRRLNSGELTLEQVTVRGVRDFLQHLAYKVKMRVFSGTDQEDVQRELRLLTVAGLFVRIHGALADDDGANKERILRDLIAAESLSGPEVMVVGDGPVEIQVAKEKNCIALAIASNEKTGCGWNESKRKRLIEAGADVIIPDFRYWRSLVKLMALGVRNFLKVDCYNLKTDYW